VFLLISAAGPGEANVEPLSAVFVPVLDAILVYPTDMLGVSLVNPGIPVTLTGASSIHAQYCC
jgi:hypothetical protein